MHDIPRSRTRPLGLPFLLGAVAMLTACASVEVQESRARLEIASLPSGARAVVAPTNAAPAPTAASTAGSPSAPYPVAADGSAALACVRTVQRSASEACAQNACGQTVVYHVRYATGATNALAVADGVCMPVPAGVQMFACRSGDRFDWARKACGR